MVSENDQPNEEEIRASARKVHRMIHSDPAVWAVYANALAQTGNYGPTPVKVTKESALEALATPTPGMQSLISYSWSDRINKARKGGEDLSTIALSAPAVINNSEPFLYGNIDSLTAGDLLELMGVENPDLEKISEEDMGKYLSELKESNTEVYEGLIRRYKSFREKQSIGFAYMDSAMSEKRYWEALQQENQDSG